jgi:RimJ/RimL family protein N-acetyltransferase
MYLELMETELTGNGFILRAWRPEDAPALQRQADNINVSRFLFNTFPHPYSLADAEHFVLSRQHIKPLANFAIVVDGNIGGSIDFKFREDIYFKSPLLGYWLGEIFWGYGIMTEAVKLVSRYAFDHYDINRIQATVNDNNPASRRVLEKAGFQKEGVLKNSIVKYGVVMDEHVYALLK